MEQIIRDDAAAAAHAAAQHIEAALSRAIDARGRASLAVSGGTSPWIMLAELGMADLDWSSVDILQVDERMAPDGDERRNLTHLQRALAGTGARRARLHPMQCGGDDADAAAAAFSNDFQAGSADASPAATASAGNAACHTLRAFSSAVARVGSE
jgi:6-phosphogluconolactonase